MLKKGGSGKIEFPGGAILSSGGANFDPGGANFDPGGANAGLPHPILRPCLKLIVFIFFYSPEKNFTCAENVNIFTILQNKLYKIAFFSKTIRDRALRVVSIEIF